jgi:hypothetical protein
MRYPLSISKVVLVDPSFSFSSYSIYNIFVGSNYPQISDIIDPKHHSQILILNLPCFAMFSGSYPSPSQPNGGGHTSEPGAPPRFGRYLGDAEKIKAAAEAVKNQTKVT